MSRDFDEPPFRFAPGDEPDGGGIRWARWLIGLALVGALVGVGVYVYLNPLTGPKWLKESGLLPRPAATVVYKWRDREGAWHITDAPPPEGVAFERLEYARDVNVLPLPPKLQEQQR
jgi:hypothetical protein